MNQTIPLSCLLLLFLFAFRMSVRSQYRVWNNGICKQSGKAWIHYSTNDNGSRCYSDGKGHFCEISYHEVDQ
jgi:hypothetical protein